MIPINYRQYNDVSDLKVWLKGLGYGYFVHNRCIIRASNYKLGAQVEFILDLDDSLSRIVLLTRKHHKKQSGEIVGFYSEDISYTLGHLMMMYKKQDAPVAKFSTWADAVESLKQHLTTLKGLDVPKRAYEDIIQNLVLSDLRDRLHNDGFKNVRFLFKAKKESSHSALILSASKCYANICISLKSGELVIGRGQDGGTSITIPIFADPKFDPNLLYKMATKTIEHMRELEKIHQIWYKHRIAVFRQTAEDYKNW